VNTAADSLEVTDVLATGASEEAPIDVRSGLLPFGFSQAKQVVLEASDSGLTLSRGAAYGPRQFYPGAS